MYQGAIVTTMDWLYPLSGFVVGAIVGLTGMGGGSLMTPLLILLFGVHPLTAVGTDLLYAAVTKTAGTAIHSKKGNMGCRVVPGAQTKAPRKPGRSQNSTRQNSGSDLGRLDLQELAGICDRNRPRLHRLRNLAHEVDV